MLAVWFLANSGGLYAAAIIAQLAGTTTIGGQVLDPAAALATSLSVFQKIGWAGVALGVVFLALSPWLKKWAHGVNDPGPSVAPEPIAITYNDVRRFGFMDLVPSRDLATCRHFARMGVEPLDGLTGAVIARLFRGRITPLKAALLDQRLIAGLGNIYVCEALHRARLHPEAPAGILARPDGRPTPKANALARAIVQVLTDAVKAGGSTLRDYAQTDGSAGAFQNAFRVYDRVGLACTRAGCTGHVGRVVQAGRSTFFCAVCQPPG